MNIIISASLAYDRIMDFPGYFKDHIMPDKIHVLSVSFLINNLVEKKGGVAGNIAYTLKLLEEDPIIIATAGKDFYNYAEHLSLHNIDQRGIKIIEEELTASARIITDKSDNQITAFHLGAMSHSHKLNLSELGIDHKNSLAIIGPDNIQTMTKRSSECKELNIPYIFDPGQQTTAFDADELCGAVDGAKILIVNDYELELVKNKTGFSLEDILSKVETLIVTLGDKGSCIYGEGNKIEIPIVSVESVDPTGAGDAYRAGLLKGLSQGWDWEKTGRVAALCGAYAVEKYGTQEHKFEVEEFRKRFKDCFEINM